MSSRVTRSSARRAANEESLSAQGNHPSTPAGKSTLSSSTQEAPVPTSASSTVPSSRKRKASTRDSSAEESSAVVISSKRAGKRPRRPSTTALQAMSQPSENPQLGAGSKSVQSQPTTSAASSRKSKSKSIMTSEKQTASSGIFTHLDSGASSSNPRRSGRKNAAESTAPSGTLPPSRRFKKLPNLPPPAPSEEGLNASQAGAAAKTGEKGPMAIEPPSGLGAGSHSMEDDYDDDHNMDDEDSQDDDDPFGGLGFGAHDPHLSSTLRALSGMAAFHPRLKQILESLRNYEDPSSQLVALQNLSETLLVSNEDQLSGHLQTDAFVKELVALMQPHPITQEENPEIMLLACRCLANLMEALPSSATSVVYGGAVPVLCEKLMSIHYIDIAEQAVSTLEKISIEHPSSIVREGGLVACLTYLDFFSTSTQRTAVNTAANCCRSIPSDAFDTVKSVMPILRQSLDSSDQRVVEKVSMCVSRIVESFKFEPSKLENLLSADLLKAVLRLLVPGTTNMIGPHIQTQFLRVLVFTARSSPALSADLFKMDVVDTLYQMLTGVSPPEGDNGVTKVDSSFIIQALIHRPREQVIETLNVICDLLPNLPGQCDPITGDYLELHRTVDNAESTVEVTAVPKRKPSDNKRIELLAGCQQEVARFARILLPILTDAFASTVNLSVRQQVMMAQLKMLSNLDADILRDALKTVPYASFLASTLSRRDHPSLSILALQAAEFLLSRLDDIYRYQLYREGVFSEINKLASETHTTVSTRAGGRSSLSGVPPLITNYHPALDSQLDDDFVGSREPSEMGYDDDDMDHDEDPDIEEENDDEDLGHGHDDEQDEVDEDDVDHDADNDIENMSTSSHESDVCPSATRHYYITDPVALSARATAVAQQFITVHETAQHSSSMKVKALEVLKKLQAVASDIESYYSQSSPSASSPSAGQALFKRLAPFFDPQAPDNATSAELLDSSLVRVLEQAFTNPDDSIANAARTAFAKVFMTLSLPSQKGTDASTPFGVLVHKLQDLLSRSEHFEVITVHHNTYGSNRSTASMLAKQIRLRLVADEDSGVPKNLRAFVVSIHAIANFKALDEYIRPKLAFSERTRAQRFSDLQRTIAAMSNLGASFPPGSFYPAFAGSALAGAGALQPSGSHSASTLVRSKSGPSDAAPEQDKSSSKGSSKSQVARPASPSHTLSAPSDVNAGARETLECSDERQLNDPEDNSLAGATGIDAVVPNLGAGDVPDVHTPTQEPAAVNMEIAPEGRVTARKEDGTRIPTPAQAGKSAIVPPPPTSGTSAGLDTSKSNVTTTASSSRRNTPAAASPITEPWHIEFSINGKVVPNDTTVYRAIINIDELKDEHPGRHIWSSVHEVKFRRVPGLPPPDTISGGAVSSEGSNDAYDRYNGKTPPSLTPHPNTATILRLLKVLYELNAHVDDYVLETPELTGEIHVEPLSLFVNTKLTAKLNRQLEEPLIVASRCLPPWAEDLACIYPFIFPFETRHLFVQSASFGYARSMSRWQSASSTDENRRDRPNPLGRLSRQKVRISRAKILESAIKVMELYGASSSVLEVEYFEEVGTGLGPTLEFYSSASREFTRRKLKMWRDVDSSESSNDFVYAPLGLFPRPLGDDALSTANQDRIFQLFSSLGKFLARSMIDSRIVDLNFNPTFFRLGDGPSSVKPTLGTIKAVDPGLASSLRMINKFAIAKKEVDEDPNRTPSQKLAAIRNITVDGSRLEDFSLDLTLPGYPHIELVPGGSHMTLSIDNVEVYLERVVDLTLGSGVRRQVDAFRNGFTQVFPFTAMNAFTASELVSLFGMVEEDWSIETLMDSIKADHGYNMDSKSIMNLLEILSKLTLKERRAFLQFATGSPKLPIGGFKNLNPMFTIVRRPSEPPLTSDDFLPSVMTCANYLKLPDYSSIEIMRKQLFLAIREGQGSFHLSVTVPTDGANNFTKNMIYLMMSTFSSSPMPLFDVQRHRLLP